MQKINISNPGQPLEEGDKFEVRHGKMRIIKAYHVPSEAVISYSFDQLVNGVLSDAMAADFLSSSSKNTRLIVKRMEHGLVLDMSKTKHRQAIQALKNDSNIVGFNASEAAAVIAGNFSDGVIV